MSNTLTRSEAQTLRLLLSSGGRVCVTMGRMPPVDRRRNVVRTSIVNALGRRGLVRQWDASRVDNWMATTAVDIAVTAAGCLALNDYDAKVTLAKENF